MCSRVLRVRGQAEDSGLQDRGQWACKAEFPLAVAGQIIGLGNVWRFPYLCYKNGEGLGFASQIMILHSCVHYIVILAWAFFYLCSSFQTPLPWSHCNNTWNTDACRGFDLHNISDHSENATSPVIEFWEREVLDLSANVDRLGSVHWRLALCLLLGGLYVFQIYDHFSCSGASLLLLSVFQSVVIGWIYGAGCFSNNIKAMIGYQPLCIFRLCWRYLTPAMCIGTFGFSLMFWSPLTLANGVTAPGWAMAMGWMLTLSSVSLLPLFAIYSLMNTPGTLQQRFCLLCRPAQDSMLTDEHLYTGTHLTFDLGTKKPKDPIKDMV